jgi:hypothetical protein
MHIPHQLPQFKGQTALLVVMGSQRGLLYIASEGRIDIIGTVEQPVARYSDREGQFYHSSGGQFFGSGGGYEDNNIERVRRFFKKTANEVFRVIRAYDVDHTYVFEPPYAKGAVTLALRPFIRDRVELVRYGNFLHAPATLLLSYIARAEDTLDPANPASVEAEANAAEKRRILAHAQQAREVIGNIAH